ncbi:MAG TPA: hypothetical protein VMC79_01335 [Rectinemataceae bacterium]|nr:hypothetical protein [Rectinemataceae bacterium]
MVFEALRAEGLDPAAHLALEEALLSLPSGAQPLLLLYINTASVIVGRNQNPWTEVSPGNGLPVYRRVSGGGAVFHDEGNLNWALFVPRASHDPRLELDAMCAALRRLGVDTRQGVRGGLYLDAGAQSGAVGAKVSGTARRFGAQRVLHHGTILVSADMRRLRESLGGLAAASSRAVASVPARAANLSEQCAGLSVRDVEGALLDELAGGSPARCAEEYLREAGLETEAELLRRRHERWDWVWGETPPFSVSVAAGDDDLFIDVRDGLVTALRGPGASALEGLRGSRFDYDLPARVAVLAHTGRP